MTRLCKYGFCASSAAADKPAAEDPAALTVDGMGECDIKVFTQKDGTAVGEPSQVWIGRSSPRSTAAVSASQNPRTTTQGQRLVVL